MVVFYKLQEKYNICLGLCPSRRQKDRTSERCKILQFRYAEKLRHRKTRETQKLRRQVTVAKYAYKRTWGGKGGREERGLGSMQEH